MPFVTLKGQGETVFPVTYEGTHSIEVINAEGAGYSLSNDLIYARGDTEEETLDEHRRKRRRNAEADAKAAEEQAAAAREKKAAAVAVANSAAVNALFEKYGAPASALSAEETAAINTMAGKLSTHLFPKGKGFGALARETARKQIMTALKDTLSRVGHEALASLVEGALADDSLAEAGDAGAETLISSMQLVPAAPAEAAGGAGAPPKGGYRRSKSQRRRNNKRKTNRRKTNRNRKTNRKY